MTVVFNAWPYARFVEIKSNHKKKNFIDKIKAPIFQEAVLAVTTTYHITKITKKSKNPKVITYQLLKTSEECTVDKFIQINLLCMFYLY